MILSCYSQHISVTPAFVVQLMRGHGRSLAAGSVQHIQVQRCSISQATIKYCDAGDTAGVEADEAAGV